MGKDGEGEKGGVLPGTRGHTFVRAVGDARGPEAVGDLGAREKVEKENLAQEVAFLRRENARLRAMLVNVWGDS